MTFAMYEALFEACERADADDAVRAVVLRGAGGKAFVAGTDIAPVRAPSSPARTGCATRPRSTASSAAWRPSASRPSRSSTASRWAPGLALSATCDLRICTPAARFGLPIARTVGNCLSMANYARLAALLGEARLKEIVLTARAIEAGGGARDRPRHRGRRRRRGARDRAVRDARLARPADDARSPRRRCGACAPRGCRTATTWSARPTPRRTSRTGSPPSWRRTSAGRG